MANFTRGEVEEIIAGVRPAGTYRRVTFDAGISSGKFPTKATMTTALTGGDNDIDYTAHTSGIAGNLISVEYAQDQAPGAAIRINVNGNAVRVRLAGTIAAESAVGTLTTDNTEVVDGDTVTIGARTYRFKNTMAQAYDVKRDGTTADTTMGNLIKAINATGTPGSEYYTGTLIHPTVTAGALASHAFTVTANTAGSAGNAIVFTENSIHLSVNGSGTLVQGTNAGAITTTAADIRTAIAAHTEAASLLDTALHSGNDGSDLVTVMAPTLLTGGSSGIVPLFTVTGTVLVSLRGYVVTTLTGASATLVHGKTGTTNDLITILTGTNLTALSGIDSTGAVARGTVLVKLPLKTFTDGQTIFATVATASVTGGVIDYICDWTALSEGAHVSVT